MHLSADQKNSISKAQGYVDLGMYRDAEHELKAIDSNFSQLPQVAAVWVQIYEKLGKWDLVRESAEFLAKQEPANAEWWLLWGLALQQTGPLGEAVSVLLQSLTWHKEDARIPFQLARHECQFRGT